MLKLLKYLKWYDYLLSIIVVAFVVGQVYLNIKLIESMGEIVGLIQAHAQGAPLTSDQLWNLGIKMILMSVGICVCVIIVAFLASKISTSFSRTLRSKVFAKINSFSMEEMNKFSTASLITRSTNDIRQVEQTVFMTLRMAVMAPIMAGFSIAKIVGSSMELSLATVVSVVLLLVLIILLFIFAVPKFTSIQKKTDKINNVTRENLTGIRVVRAYNAEKQQEQKFEVVNEDLTKTNLFVSRLMALLSPGMNLIMNGLSVAIYVLGAYLINGGALEYSVMVTFVSYAMHILMSFMFISMMFVMVPRGVVSGRRINEILATQTKIHDEEGTKTQEKGSVEFKNDIF